MVDPEQTPREGVRRAGVREVARAAGVSTQTVSRVLNGHASLREETRERVLRAIAELDFRPNNAARALGTRSTRTLGIVASDAHLLGPSRAIALIEAAARARGRWVSATYADADDVGSIVAAARHLQAQGVDGIVVVAPHTPAMAALAAEGLNAPVLPMYGDGSRQRRGARGAAEYVLRLGHRRVGVLAGPENWREADDRAQGLVEAWATAGIEPVAHWRGDWSARSGAAAAGAVADAVQRGMTAVVVANDQMALGVIAGVCERGVRVPEDLSVIGFDDHPDAAYYRPALTTVRLDLEGEAQRVVAEVWDDAPVPEPADPELIVRSSTAPVRSART